MGKFFIYNGSNTRDKKLLSHAREEELGMHLVDINQGLEQQLVGYIGRIPLDHLTEMLDDRVVSANELDDNLKLIRFVEEKPHIVRTPIIISEDDCLLVENEEDLVNEAVG